MRAVSFTIAVDQETDEWVVIATDRNGKRIERECYYTDDFHDATGTRADMQRRADYFHSGKPQFQGASARAGVLISDATISAAVKTWGGLSISGRFDADVDAGLLLLTCPSLSYQPL